jgi:hypothetical protein
MNAQTVKLQNKTLATAYRARTEWSLSEINDLFELRQTGFALVDIATYLNRSYYAVSSMLHVVATEDDTVTRSLHAMRSHRQSNEMTPACDTCWLIHSGDC